MLDKTIMRPSGAGKQRCACQCHWDLSWLRFGNSQIAVSDVDGLFVVERKRHFLFLETKRLDEPLTRGQTILLEQLSWLPQVTVLVLFGDQHHPTRLRQVKHGQWGADEITSRALFQQRVDVWYARINCP